jgi:hypothetical protein
MRTKHWGVKTQGFERSTRSLHALSEEKFQAPLEDGMARSDRASWAAGGRPAARAIAPPVTARDDAEHL